MKIEHHKTLQKINGETKVNYLKNKIKLMFKSFLLYHGKQCPGQLEVQHAGRFPCFPMCLCLVESITTCSVAWFGQLKG